MDDNAAGTAGAGPRVRPAAVTDEAAALEAGRRLFAAESKFFFAAQREGELPPPRLPEVALLGRSNVGKSSLLNALAGRRSLARISRTPGRTRQLNFFDLGGRLVLVDMPGYGHAAASKGEIAQWNALIRFYLRGRATLRRLCLLVDARHGLKPNDHEIMTLLDQAAVPFQIVLTKIDKTKPAELAAVEAEVTEALAGHPAAHPQVLATSAATGTGIPELRAEIAALAR